MLTTLNLFIVPTTPTATREPRDGLPVTASHSKTDMRGILDAGLVAWTASEENAYFLTADRVLSVIPTKTLGATVNTYRLPLDVTNAQIIYYQGFVLIAGAGRLLASPAPIRGEFVDHPFSAHLRGSTFFESRGTLFFGTPQACVRIHMEEGRLSLDDSTRGVCVPGKEDASR